MDLEEKCAVCSNTFGQHRAKTGACPRRDPDELETILIVSGISGTGFPVSLRRVETKTRHLLP